MIARGKDDTKLRRLVHKDSLELGLPIHKLVLWTHAKPEVAGTAWALRKVSWRQRPHVEFQFQSRLYIANPSTVRETFIDLFVHRVSPEQRFRV